MTDASEGLQLELLADGVERQDLLGRDVRPHGQVELPGIFTSKLKIFLFYCFILVCKSNTYFEPFKFSNFTT